MSRLLLAFSCSLAACGYTPPETTDGGIDAPLVLPSIGFEGASSGADERSGTTLITVTLSEPSADTVTVMFAVTGGTASPGVDFSITSSMLTFQAGETTKQIAVEIVDDGVEGEPTETIEITLGAPVGATLDDARKLHTVMIADRILPRVQFMSVTTSTGEDTPSQVVVTLDKPAEGASTVVLGVTGGTQGADYAVTDGTVITIPDGATQATQAIGEIDDALDEDDEQLTFTLRTPSTNLAIGNLSTATHTIVDNDNPPVLQFAVATSTAAEGAGTATVTVSLDAPSGKTITVQLDRDEAGDSAEPADVSVAGAGGSPTFAAGQVQKTVTVTINDDSVDEDDETVNLVLSSPTNATLGARSQHVLTVTDDDAAPTVTFTTAAPTRPENTGMTSLTMQLSAASEKTIVVPFVVSGTATPSTDFKITGTSRTIAPGATTALIGITVTDDSVDEDDETVVVDLQATPEAALGATPTSTLTITDNDAAPMVSFDPAQADRSAAEGDPSPAFTAFSFDVVLSAASERTVTIPFVLSGNANDPADYTVQTASPLVFAPGTTRLAINYRVVRDTTAEPNEDITFALDPNPINAQRTSPFVRTHTINNDD